MAVDAVFTRQGAAASPAALHADPLPARHPDVSEVTTTDDSGRAGIKDRLNARSLLRASRSASRRIRAAAPQLDPALVDGVLANGTIESEPAERIRRSRASRHAQ